MKRYIYILFFISCFGVVNGQITVTIGSADSNSDYYPFFGDWDYSWAYVIYTQSEINQAGYITSIQYRVQSGGAGYTMNNQSIYMRTTASTAHSSSTYDGTAGFTQVFNGSISYPSSGWKEITFDTPFYYNNSAGTHLEILTENRDGSYDNAGEPQFYYTNRGRDCTKRDYRDGVFPNPCTNCSRLDNQPDIKLTFAPYKSSWVSHSVGSSDWCGGETRSVSVTVKNESDVTWTDSNPDINIGCKWNGDADYFVRADAGGLAPGASQTYNFNMTAPATTGTNNLTWDVVVEGVCWLAGNSGLCGPGNSTRVSGNLSIDATAPSRDNVTVSSSCWTTDNSNTYTITAQATESENDYGGTYGIMTLINYQGANAGSHGGYFAWHPDSYTWTEDQVVSAGGGFASKQAGYGNTTITLVSCSTYVSGGSRYVVWTVRPNSSFPELSANDISMYCSDECGNNGGWTNFDINFQSVNEAATPADPTSDSPNCTPVTITRTGTPSGGETWYWQGTSCGTTTGSGSGATYNATSTNTYYIRARDACGQWSSGCGDVSVEVHTGNSDPTGINPVTQ